MIPGLDCAKLAKRIVGALVLVGTCVALAIASRRARPEPVGSGQAAPGLFVAGEICTNATNPLEEAVAAEQEAALRSDRYPYDPQDGIRAISAYDTAASCYSNAARDRHVERVRMAREALSIRITTDYAAARLRLSNAIDAERWGEVLRAARQLQEMTVHLKGHTYVEWLQEVIGRATARQHRSL